MTKRPADKRYCLRSSGRTICCWSLCVTLILFVSYSSSLSAPQSVQDDLLVFVCPADRGGGLDICTIRPDGTDLRRHSNGETGGEPFINLAPAWSPDGRHIAFLSNRGGTGTFDFYVMEADGSRPLRITTNVVTDNKPYSVSQAQWSPDGKRIAYVTGVDVGSLWIADVNSSVQRSLGTRLKNGVFEWVSATRVAFLAEDWSNISAVDVVSLQVQLLLRGWPSFSSMSWSPDRKRLAFSAGRGIIIYDSLYTMDADGANVRLVGPRVGAQRYAWSPDGEYIAFHTTLRAGMSRHDNVVIELIRPDGTGRRVLTNNEEANARPAWSPDGKYIAFESVRTGGRKGIYIISVDGTNERFLAAGNSVSWRPCSPCPR